MPGATWARADALYALHQLETNVVPTGRQPVFVYGHILITHPPYVFDKNGHPVPRSELTLNLSSLQWRTLYLDQVQYLNKRLEGIIDRIIAESRTPPIIILQGDHGHLTPVRAGVSPTTADKASIMNAYYLPGGGAKRLYPSISPVNTFRVVLNHYFGTKYPLLPDITYGYEVKGDKVTFERVRKSNESFLTSAVPTFNQPD